MKTFIVSIMSLLLAQACMATPPPDRSPNNQSIASERFSVERIKNNREALYAKKLKELKKKNPKKDAHAAIKRGRYYLMSYRSGRRGVHKVPGLTKQQLASHHCKYRTISGLGDSIYGKNHLKYRIAIRHYASKFNKTIRPYCE